MDRNNYKIQLIDQAQKLEIWKDKWLQLLKKQDKTTIFQRPEWIEACCKFPHNEILTCLITRDDELVCVLVFSSIKSTSSAFLYPVKVLSLEPQISTVRPPCLLGIINKSFMDVPLEEAIEKVVDKIKWDVGFFQYCKYTEKWLLTPLKKVLKRRKYHLKPGNSAPEAFIDITENPENIFESRSTKLKRSVKNSFNRLKKETKYKFIELVEEKYSWLESKKIMLDIFENTWQKDSPISPFFIKNRNYIFPVIEKFFHQDCFRIWVLFIDDQPVGFESYFLYDRILYPVMRGYHQDFKRYSPGNLLIRESLYYFHEKGIEGIYYGPFRRVDNTGYKEKWRTEIWESPNLLCIKPKSLYGMISYLFEHNKLFRKIWWKIKSNS